MNKLFGGLFLLLVTADEGTKQHIEDTYKKGEERDTVVKPFVLRKIHNKGFCLNAFDKYPKLIKSVSAVLGFIILIFDYLLFQERGRWIEKLGMVFLSAGAAGNIFDRLARGYVVDYIGIKGRKVTANLADMYVVIGMLILLIKELKK